MEKVVSDHVRGFSATKLSPAMEYGTTIIRTRENSARCLLVYRAAEGLPRKRRLVGASHTDDHACKIEVLGKGQQFVAYGRHPSGVELQ